MTAKIHPPVDNGVKAGDSGFAGVELVGATLSYLHISDLT